VTAERYLTAAELSEVMRVSLSTVRRMTRDGMPSETFGMGHTRRYLASEALAWARARGGATVDGTPRRFTAAPRKD